MSHGRRRDLKLHCLTTTRSPNEPGPSMRFCEKIKLRLTSLQGAIGVTHELLCIDGVHFQYDTLFNAALDQPRGKGLANQRRHTGRCDHHRSAMRQRQRSERQLDTRPLRDIHQQAQPGVSRVQGPREREQGSLHRRLWPNASPNGRHSLSRSRLGEERKRIQHQSGLVIHHR